MKYKDYKPTAFDQSGLGADRLGIGEWIVLPVMKTRDSCALERANFDAVLADLGGEQEEIQVHRFGHWGPGWFEIIVVHPYLEDYADEWSRALQDYPVADDELLSEYECEEAEESWNCWAGRDWNKQVCHEIEEDYPDLAEYLEDNQDVTDILWHELICQCLSWDVEHHSEGPHFNLEEGIKEVTRENILEAINLYKSGKQKELQDSEQK